jgi:hypothetical protein
MCKKIGLDITKWLFLRCQGSPSGSTWFKIYFLITAMSDNTVYSIPARFRKLENLHIIFWLIKDMAWAMLWKPLAVLMIIPTIGAALIITAQTWKIRSERFHNLAIDFWITANGYWMLSEFFGTDSMRYYAIFPFSIGILIIAYWYLIEAPAQKKKEAIMVQPVEMPEFTKSVVTN